MTDFDRAKLHRNEGTDENGNSTAIPWEEALKKAYFKIEYKNVTPQNADIAQNFEKRGLSQETFKIASDLRKIADKKKKSCIFAH